MGGDVVGDAVGEDDVVGEDVVGDAVGDDDGVGALFGAAVGKLVPPLTGAAVGGAGVVDESGSHGVSGNP